MSAPASHLLAGVLLDASAKATVLLAVGFVADGLSSRGSAAARHAQWAVLLLALPLLGPVAIAVRGAELAVEASWLGGVWAVGVGIALLPLLGGRLWLEALVRRGTPIDGLVVARAGDLAGPITFGGWRPRVVVPADWFRWPAADREAALAHERAHVARGDWAVQTATALVCVLFWFHPLVWWAHARLVTAAEHAADDQVLLSGVKPSAYARALLTFSQLRAAPAGVGAGRSAEPRIRAVLAEGHRTARRWPTAVALVAALLVLVPLLGAVPLGSPPPPTCRPLEDRSALTPEDYAARRQVSTCPEGTEGTDEIQLTRSRVRAARARIDALQGPDRLEARLAANLLLGNCPWNRASVQLPVALALVAGRHDAARLDGEVGDAWLRLQLGLAEHVALLDPFGVTALRAPLPGEYLANHPDVVLTRIQLHAAADPLAATRPLLDQIPALVDSYDLATREFIEMDSLQLRHHTAEQWPYAGLLDGWREALVALEPKIRDEALLRDVRAMIDALDAYGQTGC